VVIPAVAARAVARVRAGAWPAAQCGLAASLAWAFSVHVLGHPRPFFASVAAVVALGLRAGQRLRRTAELAVGVAIGVLVGDLLVSLIGSGAWQIGVVVTAGLIIAVACGGSGLVVTQSGLQAVFVVALPRTPNSGFHRWQDALVGGGIALLVAALLSTDPWREARRLRTTYLAELAATLREAAAGLRAGSSEQVAATLERARRLEPFLSQWHEALVTGRETTRLSPLREDRAAFWQSGQQLTRGLSRATRNLRVLVRRVVAALQAGQSLPPCLPDLLEELAAALDPTLETEEACMALLAVAVKLDPVELGATSFAGQIAVGQLRVAVVDLLEGLGLEHDRARNSLPELAA
jgi:uncharacterized membrane protein YgaE (UPF0421/DUF939 family)